MIVVVVVNFVEAAAVVISFDVVIVVVVVNFVDVEVVIIYVFLL